MSSIIRATTSSGLQVAPDNSGSLQLQTNGTTTAVTIDTSQNVGIGTTSPASKLNLQGSSSNWVTFSTSGTNKAYVGVDNGTPELVVGASAGDLVIRSNQKTWFGTNGGGVAAVIDSSGNVGIGTSSPTQKLQVYTSAGSGGQIQITNSSTGATSTDGVLIGYDGSNDVIFNNQENTQTKFYTSGIERMRIDSSGNLLFNSGYGSAATAYGCRAWVNFNGTGTVAIRASGNVTSITDVGTGNYTVNFTTSMTDANYSASGGATSGTSTAGRILVPYTYNTGSVSVACITDAGSNSDPTIATVIVHR